MNRRLLFGVAILMLVAAVTAASRSTWQDRAVAAPDAPNAPQGFASPINAGCYIAAEGLCKIHVDPFVININDAAGARLERFTLFANGNPVYDFRTDVSNPPGVDYAPSLVMEDFAAQCGQAYVVNLVAKDTTDANPLNYGQTAEFTCPTSVP